MLISSASFFLLGLLSADSFHPAARKHPSPHNTPRFAAGRLPGSAMLLMHGRRSREREKESASLAIGNFVVHGWRQTSRSHVSSSLAAMGVGLPPLFKGVALRHRGTNKDLILRDKRYCCRAVPRQVPLPPLTVDDPALGILQERRTHLV